MNKRLRCTAFLVLCMMTVAQMPLIADEKKEDYTPVPYTKEEFPLWQRELRRFEILSFGSLPFVTLLSFWGYDMIRSAQHPNDPGYYPWPFKQADRTIPLTEREQLGIFLTSMGISMGVALIDIIYRAVKRSAERKRLERENAFTEDPIQFMPAPHPLEDDISALSLNTDAVLSAGSIGGIATVLEKVTASTPSVQGGKTGTAAQ